MVTVTIELDDAAAARLRAAAEGSHLDAGQLAALLVEDWLNTSEWDEEMERRLRRADAGEFASDERVAEVLGRDWTSRRG